MAGEVFLDPVVAPFPTAPHNLALDRFTGAGGPALRAGRVCRCGCRTAITHLRSDALYASEACSKRFRRARAVKRRQRRASPDKARTRRRRTNWKRLYLQGDPYQRPMHFVR